MEEDLENKEMPDDDIGEVERPKQQAKNEDGDEEYISLRLNYPR